MAGISADLTSADKTVMSTVSTKLKKFTTSTLVALGTFSIVDLAVARDPSVEIDCRRSFENLTFTAIDLKSPRISEFLNSRAIQRIQKTQPESFKKFENFIATPPKQPIDESVATSSINFRDQSLRAEVSLEREREVLTVNLDYVALVQHQATGTRTLKVGEENPSLHLGFPRFITAIADGLNRQVAADPSIRRIVIEGKFVMNQELAEHLSKLGFESKPSSASVLNMTKKGAAGPAAFFNAMLQVLVPSFPETSSNAVVIKGVSAGTATALKVRSALKNNLTGRDWKLVLDLEDAAASAGHPTVESP